MVASTSEPREFAEWMMECAAASWPRCLLDACCFHLLLLVAVRRPNIARRYRKVWDWAQDIIHGIEAGAFPKPNWYEMAKAKDGEYDRIK